MTIKYLPLAITLGLLTFSGVAFAYKDGGKVNLVAPSEGLVVPLLAKEQQLAPCLARDTKTARMLLTLKGVYSDVGNIRVQVYNNNPNEFLAKGKKLIRIDVPAQKKKSMVCVTFPTTGKFALAILHDRNANGKTDFLTEGFGFSNNPTLLFSAPDHEDVVIDVKNGLAKETIKLTYIFKSNEKNRRRKKRR